jgi:hypothetical protein
MVVQNARRHHVLQTVIGLFFCAYDGLVAFLASADDVVGHVENLNLDPLHVLAGNMVLVFKFQGAFDGRLRMDFGVVFLYDGVSHSLEVLFRLVDFEVAYDRIHKTFVPFEDFKRAGDAAPGQERRARCTKGRVRIGQPFPMRKRPGSRDTQRIKRSSGNGDGIGGLRFAQT